MFGINRKYLKLQQEKIELQKNSIIIIKNILEESIMTINQIQNIQKVGITEKEKDIIRNKIINCKRSQFIDKMIELDYIINTNIIEDHNYYINSKKRFTNYKYRI